MPTNDPVDRVAELKLKCTLVRLYLYRYIRDLYISEVRSVGNNCTVHIITFLLGISIMEIASSNFKQFSSALTLLSRVGKDILVEVEPSRTSFKALSDAKSSFAHISFLSSFFSYYSPASFSQQQQQQQQSSSNSSSNSRGGSGSGIKGLSCRRRYIVVSIVVFFFFFLFAVEN